VATIATQLWVCTDCRIAIEYGLGDATVNMSQPDEDAFTERYLAGLDRECHGIYGYLVNGGSHNPDCANDGESDCDCEYDSFSRGWCDLCHSHLAGERFAATILQP
jgi:hypothetical protein